MNFTSVLFYKPVLKKIKPSELGYVSRYGGKTTINFQSPESAQRYAKNVVVKALNAPKPFERAVTLHGSTVTNVIDGTEDRVSLKKIVSYAVFDTFVHGHPDHAGEIAGTFSPADLKILFSTWPVQKLVVYNARGEYAMIKKKIGPESYTREIYNDFFDNYLWKNRNALDEEKVRANKVLQNMDDEIQAEIDEEGSKLLIRDLETNKEKLKSLPEDILDDCIYSKVYKIATNIHHNIVKKFAKAFNLEYETNFSNLV